MIGAPVPGVVNALQVTIPGRSPSVPSVKALGNARDEKKEKETLSVHTLTFPPLSLLEYSILIYGKITALTANVYRAKKKVT